jgi:protein-disulfide isomerase
MPDSHPRRAALATLFGGAVGLLTAAPALAWHDTQLGRPQSGAAPRGQPSGPQAEENFGTIPLRETDFVLGADDAPITLIKYASLTCPHCASFHASTAAELKRDHIPEGRVRYIHRHSPLDQLALAGAMLLHCGNGSQEWFFALLDMLYSEQSDWATAADPIDALRRLAARTGLNAEEFNACLSDQALADRILEERAEGVETFGVRSTPTLLVNGARFSGSLSMAQLDTIMERVG